MKRKTHLVLLFWVFLLLAGSTFWLRYTLQGDKTGHPVRYPQWFREPPALRLEVQAADCVYEEPDSSDGATLAETRACGADNAAITIIASLEDVPADGLDGLFLNVLVSNDFVVWSQANDILLPRDMFHNESAPTDAQLSRVQRTFDEAAIGSVSRAAAENVTAPAADLVRPLQSLFSGAGAIELSEATVLASLKGARGLACAAPCATSAGEFVAAYESLRARYAPTLEVKTQACVGRPGFAYLAACLVSGAYASTRRGATCSAPPCKGVSGPPFSDCLAVASWCGGTCGALAGEPWPRRCHAAASGEAPLEIAISELERYYLRTQQFDFGSLLFGLAACGKWAASHACIGLVCMGETSPDGGRDRPTPSSAAPSCSPRQESCTSSASARSL